MVFHLPRFNSDHLPILIRTDAIQPRKKRSFRCENWWLASEGFKEVCQRSAQSGQENWFQVSSSFKQQVRQWAVKNKSPDVKLKEIEQQMLALNYVRMDDQSKELEKKLQINHKCLQLQEYFWHQRARVNWAVHRDQNSRFFHAMA